MQIFRLSYPILISMLAGLRVCGQTAYLPFTDYTYHLLDRYSILYGQNCGYYTGFKPLDRRQIADAGFLRDNRDAGVILPMHREFLLTDNHLESGVWHDTGQSVPFLKRFYRNPSAFYAFREGHSLFQIDPVFGFSAGITENEEPFQNTRGFTARGGVGGKFGFYTFVSENQVRFPQYFRDFVHMRSAIPGTGFFKPFGENGYDFFQARGYITCSPVKAVRVLFGHDKLFVGNGFRSLIWSDHAKEHLMLRVHTHFGKVHYHNVFSELADLDYLSGSGDGVQKKYSAFHYLGLDLVPGKFNVGFFEQVVFQRLDSQGLSRGYDPNYLNPVIFYRAIEHGLNSSDNALLGMDWKWNILNRYSIYGQWVLDEFVKREMFKRTGWWGNKWALQTGFKWINVLGVQALDLQLEANWVRPYTYAHSSDGLTVSHYNQALAHPLGANFREQLLIIRYQPLNRWNLRAQWIHAERGLDPILPGSANYGSNIIRLYSPDNRPKERGIRIGEGLPEILNLIDMLISYQPFHNTFLDLRLIARTNELEGNMWYLGGGLRMNFDLPRFDF